MEGSGLDSDLILTSRPLPKPDTREAIIYPSCYIWLHRGPDDQLEEQFVGDLHVPVGSEDT